MDNNTVNSEPLDLISIKGLDEMQREQTYKIAFNCFKAFYWSNIILATMLILGSIFYNDIFFDENLTLTYSLSFVGIIITLLSSIIYIIFAVKTSNIGVMNPNFVNIASSPKQIILMSGIGFGYTIVVVSRYLNGESVTLLFFGIFISIFYISHIITYFLARKNKKLINETEED